MEDHRYHLRVARPPIIVVKEDVVWKLAGNEKTQDDIISETSEEPEVEWAVSNDIDAAEDPLLISDTEDNSQSTESSLVPESYGYFRRHVPAPVIEENKHFIGIPHLDDDLEEDFEVAELLKQNNELLKEIKSEKNGIKEKIEDNHKPDVDCVGFINILNNATENNEKKSNLDKQSFLDDKVSSSNKVSVKNNNNNKSKNNHKKSEKYVKNPRSILKCSYSEIKNNEIISINRSEKYSLRTRRSIVKRYSPVDFEETVERNFKKTRSVDKNVGDGFRKDNINGIKQKTTTKDNKNNNINIENFQDRRSIHNILERGRREVLTRNFENLSSLFPQQFKVSDKMAKVTILNHAIKYIHVLEDRDVYLGKTKKALLEKRIKLYENLEKLQKQVLN